ncbi:unannotated protein [freshwater metagenome]|uniref:Unannotated protein n=1 Tax=freshwater metagenome TaxID=449393 RepID=A0A6J6M105_9ZZZZ
MKWDCTRGVRKVPHHERTMLVCSFCNPFHVKNLCRSVINVRGGDNRGVCIDGTNNFVGCNSNQFHTELIRNTLSDVDISREVIDVNDYLGTIRAKCDCSH